MSTKLGRNDPCHCGSGKKYKKCHLALDEQARSTSAPAEAASAEEPHHGFDEPALDQGPGLGDYRSLGEAYKKLARSGLMKRDPELRRLMKGHETLLTYLAHREEIEAASEKLKPYEEEFRRLFDDEEALIRRNETLFDEETFAPFRFTAEQVEKAFQKVGFPLNLMGSEAVAKGCLDAILFLASKEYRDRVCMELLLLMPGYVDQGRFLDARLIAFAAETLVEHGDEGNPFLFRMFLRGYEEWADRSNARQKSLLREVGLPPNQHLGPAEIDAWVAEQTADPAKTARLKQLLEKNPELRSQSTAMLDEMRTRAVRLFDREDSERLLLDPEEFAPWDSFLAEKLQVLQSRFGLAEGGPPLSEAQQQAGFSEVLVPAMQELAKGIFTPERIRELVAELRAYRNDLFAAGEKTAAFCAMGAINYVEPEDDPSQNVFLLNLCARSLYGFGSDMQEDPGEVEGLREENQ